MAFCVDSVASTDTNPQLRESAGAGEAATTAAIGLEGGPIGVSVVCRDDPKWLENV
jgi:hypothetical protein